MSKRLEDVANSNLLLFDLLFRQQVYLEGIKAGVNIMFRRMLKELYSEFARYMGLIKYDNLDGLTRVELQQFIYRFQRAQATAYNSYTQKLIKLLQEFLSADADMTDAIYAKVNAHPTAKPVKTAKQSSLSHVETSKDSIWNRANTDIVPASGQTMREMITNFGEVSLLKVKSRFASGYANDETPRSVLVDIVGSHDGGFRDGLFSVFASQNAALTATLLQHVSNITQAAIGASHYSKYQWVSILDSRTTAICRSRNGNVYVYGKGPLPPAHWWCRSKVVSLTNGEELHNIPSTFYGWLITQPNSFLVDALGATLAARIIARYNSAKDISINSLVKPLTVSQFREKIKLVSR